jgi:class 3 adenylate cyclase
VTIEVGSHDEFADLAKGFNRITARIESLIASAEVMERDRNRLIDNLLPAAAAGRMKAGQPPEPDDYPEVSILYAGFLTQGEAGLRNGVDKSLALLNDLTIALDDAAERRGVDKLSGDGVSYVASCGLSRQRLDYASRTVDFALDMLRIVQRLQRDRQADFQVRIGIASGAAAGCLAGRTRFSYHLAGEPVALAALLSALAPADGILVSRELYTSAQNLYRFGPPVNGMTLADDPVCGWPVVSPDAPEGPAAQANAVFSASSAGSNRHEEFAAADVNNG